MYPFKVAKRARTPIDRRLGISTSRKVRISVAPGDGPLARYARDYEPTPPEIFEAMMTEVRFPLEAASFVDLGAGKGRVLCLAACLPFREVIGCELFEPLAAAARANLAALDQRWIKARKLTCVTADAGAFSPPPGPKVVFLFNPFGPPVLRRALDRLAAERDEDGHGPPIYLLYYEPVHAKHVDAHPWLERRAEASHWAVWASSEAP